MNLLCDLHFLKDACTGDMEDAAEFVAMEMRGTQSSFAMSRLECSKFSLKICVPSTGEVVFTHFYKDIECVNVIEDVEGGE